VSGPAPSARPYAGLVSRVGAILVDVLLLTMGVLIIGALPPAAAQAVLGVDPPWLARACGLAGTVLPWVYFTGCWWLAGETAGGLVFGLQVRRLDGRSLGLVRAGVRALVGLAFAPLWTLGLLGVLTDRHRRAWHDRIFGTVVRYAHRSRDAGEPAVGAVPARPDS
jgi:uncharacterized RDD family membrane protein YckC